MALGRAESDFGPQGLNGHYGAETDLFNFQCNPDLLRKKNSRGTL